MGISGVAIRNRGMRERLPGRAGYRNPPRLFSSPLHIAFMESRNIVPEIGDAIDIISGFFTEGYVSWLTGPSRTADIERVLTIGVHGPGRLVIIAVDEGMDGGAV